MHILKDGKNIHEFIVEIDQLEQETGIKDPALAPFARSALSVAKQRVKSVIWFDPNVGSFLTLLKDSLLDYFGKTKTLSSMFQPLAKEDSESVIQETTQRLMEPMTQAIAAHKNCDQTTCTTSTNDKLCKSTANKILTIVAKLLPQTTFVLLSVKTKIP